MGETSEPFIKETRTAVPINNKRIVWLTVLVLVAGFIYCLVFEGRKEVLGILIGGGLFFINYFWLGRSLEAIFKSATSGEKPRFLAAKYFLRYLTVGSVIALVYYTEAASILTTILGFAAISVAVLIEGFIRIFSSVFKRREN